MNPSLSVNSRNREISKFEESVLVPSSVCRTKQLAFGIASALLIFSCNSSSAFAAHIGHISAGGGHVSGGHHSGSYHSSHGGGGYGRGYGGYGYGYDTGYAGGSNAYNVTYDGLAHNYDPGHPVQTGASFSGPAQIDPSQYHYFVQEYSWPSSTARAMQ